MGSEWGRLYEHRNRECRALSGRTGKRRGGQVVLAGPPVPREMLVEVESCSLGGYERLALETVDMESGSWKRAALVGREEGPDGWTRSRFSFPATPLDPLTLEQALDRVAAMNRPAAAIEAVTLLASGEERTVLKERQPFAVRVVLQAHAPLSRSDIGIKFTRSDGVYVFWQSSGLVGQEVPMPDSGRVEVEFAFDENVLGAGDYSVNAYVANGWDFPANYPYSEVYDRKVGCLQFKVLPAVPGLDMGVVNQRARVIVRRSDEVERNDVQATAEVAR